MTTPDQTPQISPEEWAIATNTMQHYDELYNKAYDHYNRMAYYRFPEKSAAGEARTRLAQEAAAPGSELSPELMRQAEETIDKAHRINIAFDKLVYSETDMTPARRQGVVETLGTSVLSQALAAKERSETGRTRSQATQHTPES